MLVNPQETFSPSSTPSIFQYDNYRSYLKDHCEHEKARRKNFTLRRFAQRAGLASHMHLRLVMEGERNLSHKTIAKFSKGLGLKKREAAFFEALVYFNQATTSDAKLEYYERLRRLVKARSTPMNAQLQESLFSTWYVPIVYELAHHKDFRPEADFVCTQLKDQITSTQARQVIQTMLDLKLWIQTSDGKWGVAYPQMKTDDEIENLLIRRFQKQMIERSVTCMDLPLQNREYGFVTACTTEENFQKLKARVKELIQEFNEMMSTSNGSAKGERVYQINIQAFPLT